MKNITWTIKEKILSNSKIYVSTHKLEIWTDPNTKEEFPVIVDSCGQGVISDLTYAPTNIIYQMMIRTIYASWHKMGAYCELISGHGDEQKLYLFYEMAEFVIYRPTPEIIHFYKNIFPVLGEFFKENLITVEDLKILENDFQNNCVDILCENENIQLELLQNSFVKYNDNTKFICLYNQCAQKIMYISNASRVVGTYAKLAL